MQLEDHDISSVIISDHATRLSSERALFCSRGMESPLYVASINTLSARPYLEFSLFLSGFYFVFLLLPTLMRGFQLTNSNGVFFLGELTQTWRTKGTNGQDNRYIDFGIFNQVLIGLIGNRRREIGCLLLWSDNQGANQTATLINVLI